MRVHIVLESEGRIAGLHFAPPRPIGVGLRDAIRRLDEVEGELAYLLVREGSVLARHRTDVAMAVGSAFKLGILAVLEAAVQRGERRWDETVELKARHVSRPSGMLQDWPVGTPLTLRTAAALMISKSDNTATDLLIDVVGRDRVAEALGIELALTTREFFQLKEDPASRRRFLAAAPADRRGILLELSERPLPRRATFVGHHDRGIEWYVDATRLCRLIAAVAHLDLMGLNPGVATASDWKRIAYKGGSERGVLNLTTHVTTEAGISGCIALSVNAATTIPHTKVFSIYAGLLSALKGE